MANRTEDKTTTPPRVGLRVLRVVRATLAASVVMGCFGFIALKASYARASDAAMNFGDELLHLGERNPSGEVSDSVYHLDVNGQEAQTTNGFTKHSVTEVLDYFKAQCDQHAQGLTDKFADLDSSLVNLTPAGGAPGYATIRGEKSTQGFVFCASADHPVSDPEKLSRFKTLTSTGDLGSLGDIRYVAVQQVEGGTQVAAVWTHGAFNLYAMFPRTGDAPGQDFVAAPRPDDSKRIFTGRIGNAPYGVNVYQVNGEPDMVFGGVDTKLKAAGWKAIPVYKRIPKVAHAYSMGENLDIIVNINKSSGDKSSVSYVVSQMAGSVSR